MERPRLGCIIAVACTTFYAFYAPHVAVSISWSPISLVVVFPISQGISFGFKRREQALMELGYVFSNSELEWIFLTSDFF